ncbi:hypothetical protein D9758_002847 [Tetrapyrgos nigripes]|uniref:F-box domain-containing protein n=1 Tax=Tetrapyrgos nigripes TaxID=182062 RepID=A0A8H5GQF8_9AGAR|nr:hypothetical protein D9758_002847 [Tetrapyrgos nigripes]
MAGEPWVNQNYYGNSAPYAFAYNASNSSEAYKYNNGYNYANNYNYNNYRPTPAGSASGAYSQGNYQPNYAPSVTSSMRDGAYGGYDKNAGYTGASAGAGAAGAAESLNSRWSTASAPRENKSEDVVTMMNEGKFTLHETKVARNIKEYRREYREGMWTRGTRVRIFGRFFCFFILFLIYLVISAILGVALYIRPPSATFDKPNVNQKDISFDNGGLVVPLQMNISIWNPTFIKAVVKRVHVDLFYPLNNEERPIGNGTIYDVWIKSNSRTNFTFPIDVDYELATDPNFEILTDIAKRCGGQQQQGLSIKAKAMVAANILGIGVSSPTVPIDINIGCPFDPIFEFCDPKGLLSLSHTNREFRNLLKNTPDSVWKAVRENVRLPELEARDITESQYITLVFNKHYCHIALVLWNFKCKTTVDDYVKSFHPRALKCAKDSATRSSDDSSGIEKLSEKLYQLHGEELEAFVQQRRILKEQIAWTHLKEAERLDWAKRDSRKGAIKEKLMSPELAWSENDLKLVSWEHVGDGVDKPTKLTEASWNKIRKPLLIQLRQTLISCRNRSRLPAILSHYAPLLDADQNSDRFPSRNTFVELPAIKRLWNKNEHQPGTDPGPIERPHVPLEAEWIANLDAIQGSIAEYQAEMVLLVRQRLVAAYLKEGLEVPADPIHDPFRLPLRELVIASRLRNISSPGQYPLKTFFPPLYVHTLLGASSFLIFFPQTWCRHAQRSGDSYEIAQSDYPESEDYEEKDASSSKYTRPGRKRVATKDVNPVSRKLAKSERKKRLDLGKFFDSIPTELQWRIFECCDPKGLLSLSYTNKEFRSLLKDTPDSVWKVVRGNAGMPELEARDITERQYITLVFNKYCHSCGQKNVQHINYANCSRLCAECRSETYCSPAFLFRMPPFSDTHTLGMSSARAD